MVDHSAMHTSYRNGKFLTVTLVFALFLILSMPTLKDNSQAFATSEFWSEYTSSSFLQALRKTTFLWGAFFCFSLVFVILYIRKIQIYNNSIFAIFFLCYIYIYSRSSFEDIGFSVKYFLVFMLLLMVYVAASSVQAARVDFYGLFLNSVASAAAFAVMINIYEFLSGNGYVPLNPRFFGAAAHPNFTGVQMGVCGLVFAGLLHDASLRFRIVFGTLLAMALFVLYLTGSRTGLLVFFSGLTIYLAQFIFGSKRFIVLKVLFVLFFGAACAVFLVGGDQGGQQQGSVYDRGDSADTRSVAWNEMLRDIVESPIIGRGFFEGASENSWLRGWAAFGILYPVLQALLVAAIVRKLGRIGYLQSIKSYGVIVAVMVGLLAGSMLEGYIVDSFSFPMMMWCFCILNFAIIPVGSGRAKAQLMGSMSHGR